MKKVLMALALAAGVVFLTGRAVASPGFYLALEAGLSTPNFSLRSLDVDFEGTRSFLYGVKAGFKFLIFAVEGNLLTASHDIFSKEIAFPWEGNGIGMTYWGINGKLFFPILIVHPYIMAGYGSYSMDVNDIGKDSNRGYNIGVGLEVKLGKLGVFAEGRYHHVTVNVAGDLNMSNYTLTFGALYDF